MGREYYTRGLQGLPHSRAGSQSLETSSYSTTTLGPSLNQFSSPSGSTGRNPKIGLVSISIILYTSVPPDRTRSLGLMILLEN